MIPSLLLAAVAAFLAGVLGGFTVTDQLHVDTLSFDGDLVTIHASTEGHATECPLCERPSRRVHGRYTRTLADLPWCGIPVRLRVRVRKFFCDEPSCERKIFALGGEAGARLARELGLLVSPDTLLNRIRGVLRPDAEEVRVVGVDDFGFRKGNAPGTILVDLERHEVADLFEGHSVRSIARWLGQHPGVEVVARDRSHVCREGVNAGAPDALQVADRWHLLRSLALGLEEFLLSKRSARGKAAAAETGEGEGPLPGSIDGDASTLPVRLGRPYKSVEGPARKRHERLLEQWKNIRRLYLAGADLRHICRQLGISARTVYRYKDLTEPPPRPAYKRHASVLDPYVPYLVKRWKEGCHNGKRLYREIRERGYANSEETCARFTAQLRRAEVRGKPISSVPRARQGSVAGLSPTAKNVAALFMRHEEKLGEEQEAYLGRLCDADVALADTRRLTQEFAEMVRKLEGEDLGGWLKEAEESRSTALQSFAAGLRKDLDAVRAGLTEKWSNGPVEGFVHKLKLLKRQGYGRAGFDLLRARMLAA